MSWVPAGFIAGPRAAAPAARMHRSGGVPARLPAFPAHGSATRILTLRLRHPDLISRKLRSWRWGWTCSTTPRSCPRMRRWRSRLHCGSGWRPRRPSPPATTSWPAPTRPPRSTSRQAACPVLASPPVSASCMGLMQGHFSLAACDRVGIAHRRTHPRRPRRHHQRRPRVQPGDHAGGAGSHQLLQTVRTAAVHHDGRQLGLCQAALVVVMRLVRWSDARGAHWPTAPVSRQARIVLTVCIDFQLHLPLRDAYTAASPQRSDSAAGCSSWQVSASSAVASSAVVSHA